MTDAPDPREIHHYDKLVEKVKELLHEGRERSETWLDDTLARATDQLHQAEEMTKEEAHRAREYLRRDLEATREDFNQALAATKLALDPSRTRAGFLDLLAHLLDALGDTFKAWAARSEQTISFHTGQVTGAGTLTCRSCGSELHLTHTAHIPPCPSCHKTEFRKSY